MSDNGTTPGPDGQAGVETDSERIARVAAEEEESEAVRKKIAELQSKLDGNRVAPGTARTQQKEPDIDQRGRIRTRSSTGQADNEYRETRRRGRDRRRSLSPYGRSPPMSPWSCLGEEGRPANKTRQQINAMGVDACLRLKGWEREEEQRREAQLARPGRRVVEESKPRAAVEVPACVDDGTGQLSAGRFLRPPTSPTSWWKQVPKSWPPGEAQQWARYNGTQDSMPVRYHRANGNTMGREGRAPIGERWHAPIRYPNV